MPATATSIPGVCARLKAALLDATLMAQIKKAQDKQNEVDANDGSTTLCVNLSQLRRVAPLGDAA
eukprot:1609137-Rhodomonas_salina.1